MHKQALMVGKPVYTADGALLGEVKAMRDHYFEIRGRDRGQPNYWLTVVDIVTAPWVAQVVVAFDREELVDHKTGHKGD